MAIKYQNILLIDDDTDDQEIFLEAVEQISATATCIAFSDAANALQKLIAKEMTPDVIFLDLNMPIMTGQQFLLEIKKHHGVKNIPVIIFSTTSHLRTIALTKEMGALDFITKPSMFNDLLKVLTPLLT
jgi:DNA-binding NtrC family response regulator